MSVVRPSCRVINGECLKIMRGFADETVNLIVTDPPYGINYLSGFQIYDHRSGVNIRTGRPPKFGKISGDTTLPTEWLHCAYRVLKNDSAIYVFTHWSKWGEMQAAVSEAGFKCKSMIVMAKSNSGMGDLKGQFAPSHELLLFAVKGRHLLNFPEGRMQDVWNVPMMCVGPSRVHPNQKPISWMIPCIENSSRRGDLILDPFAGSGTVGVAAKQLGRRCTLIEIDAAFCGITTKRLADTRRPAAKEKQS